MEGENILRRAACDLGLTQTALAEQAETTQATISRLMRPGAGAHAAPLLRVALALNRHGAGITLVSLFDEYGHGDKRGDGDNGNVDKG